ncbi:MAG: BON domain-containing protein [Capsulimonas sp.]|uniref:BON domain-containing protein n=1 Tax=Capsulimonas sp. TaxID=2494211 RepID=UPI003266AA0C
MISLHRSFSYSILIGAGLLGAGCSQSTINGVEHDTKNNAAIVQHEADKALKTAKPQLDKLSLGARVTAAIQANANLPKTIRVDAGSDGVKLRGKVQNAKQKALAGRIAADTLPSGKTVQNDLTIEPS